MCCTNERYKTYQTGFSFCHLGHAPGVGFLGVGVPRGVKRFFFKHGHVAYQIDGDDKQNKMQVNFHPRVKLVTLVNIICETGNQNLTEENIKGG